MCTSPCVVPTAWNSWTNAVAQLTRRPDDAALDELSGRQAGHDSDDDEPEEERGEARVQLPRYRPALGEELLRRGVETPHILEALGALDEGDTGDDDETDDFFNDELFPGGYTDDDTDDEETATPENLTAEEQVRRQQKEDAIAEMDVARERRQGRRQSYEPHPARGEWV